MMCISEFSRSAVELQVQAGEALVHAVTCPVGDGLVRSVSLGVLVCELVNVPESQERFQLQGGAGRGFQQFHLDEHLVLVRHYEYALAENNLSHLVCDLRNSVRVKVNHVFVSPGLIYVPVAVDAKVELLPVHYEALVKTGQHEVPVASETVQRHGKQAVIAPRITSND